MVTIAGKADPTLVKMATAAEMADKPVSMQAEFKGITDTFTTYMTGIGALYAKVGSVFPAIVTMLFCFYLCFYIFCLIY